LEEVGQIHINPHKSKLFLGQAGEHLVCFLFGMWEYRILQPVQAFGVYDLVVERNGVFKKLQVKTRPLNALSVSLLKSINYSNNRKDREQYKEGDFDYLCACTFPNVYVVPFDKIKSPSCVTFSHYPEYCYDITDPRTFEIRPDITRGT